MTFSILDLIEHVRSGEHYGFLVHPDTYAAIKDLFKAERIRIVEEEARNRGVGLKINGYVHVFPAPVGVLPWELIPILPRNILPGKNTA